MTGRPLFVGLMAWNVGVLAWLTVTGRFGLGVLALFAVTTFFLVRNRNPVS